MSHAFNLLTHQALNNDLEPLRFDLNKPLSISKATNNEVIPLPAKATKKDIPIIVVLKKNGTQFKATTLNKPQQQIQLGVTVNDPLAKRKQPAIGVTRETSTSVPSRIEPQEPTT